MKLFRFIKRLVVDPVGAWRSVVLLSRRARAGLFWKLHPTSPFRVRLPGGGVLLLERGHSFTQFLWPNYDGYEPEVRGVLEAHLKPGAVFVDCGANVGYFSVIAGKLVGDGGRVVSVEANPLTLELLNRNLAANDLGRAVHCALVSRPGEVEIHMPARGDVFSSIRVGGFVVGNGTRSWKVQGRTLDSVVEELQLKRIDLIKIDIEGGELDVLRSALRCMDRFRPLIITEYGTTTWPVFNATGKDLVELAESRNYDLRLFDVRTGKQVDLPETTWESGYINILLVPRPR